MHCIAFVNDLMMIGGVVEDYRQRYPADKLNKQLVSVVTDPTVAQPRLVSVGGSELGGKQPIGPIGWPTIPKKPSSSSVTSSRGWKTTYWQCPQFVRRTCGR